MTETVATTPVGTLPARRTKAKAAPVPMIDRYKLIEKVGIYAGLFVFLFFVLAPFIEGFRVSLRPLDHLFSSPYVFWPSDAQIDSYFTMWTNVPLLGRYIFNSLFISVAATIIARLARPHSAAS